MKQTLGFLAVVLSSAAFAQVLDADSMQGVHGQGRMYMGQLGAALAEGEVRKVDRDAATLTLRHGPVPSMDMPAMTMIYRVRDSAMLDHVEASDRVRFSMEKIDGAFTVVKIEPASYTATR